MFSKPSTPAKRGMFLWLLAFLLLLITPFSLAAPTTPTEDLTDNGDGTVTHRITGLTWMRCAMGQTWDGSTCTGTVSTYTWYQATKLTANFAGKSDWRLPSIAELNTIVERGTSDPAINGTIFPNTPSSYFWSGSPYADDSYSYYYAWGVYFGDGGAYGVNRYGSLVNAVRLVRGGQSFDPLAAYTPSIDFFDNGDGTVTHLKTGLMWKRCAEGQTWSGTTCSGSASTYDWGTAVALTSSSAGHNDWRIPTENELLTIVEYQAYAPAINTVIFPTNTTGLGFWSGSPYASNSSSEWNVSFSHGGADGYGYYGYRSYSLAVRLVRDGQFFGSLGFAAQADVAPGIVLTSNLLKIAPGSSAAVPIAIVGGSYAINGGTYTTAPGTVHANDSVSVRVTSSAGLGVSTRATLTVGGIGGNFIVTTRAAGDSQPPSVPTNLTASASTDNTINLTWSAATDNVGVTAYRVVRNGSWLTSLGAVTRFTDSGLSAATAYSYSVAACNAVGNCSAQSAAASATTLAPIMVLVSTTPTTDFIDNGDGTVTHRITGLTWMRCAVGMTWTGRTCTGTPSHYIWDDATKLTSNFADKSDWRLPSIAELNTLVERESVNPAINGTIFPNTPTGSGFGPGYWSGSLDAVSSSYAWSVSFGYGGAYNGGRDGSGAVRLVRGGQSFDPLAAYTPSIDFFDNGDGTVTHLKTGLMWKRCAEGQTWSGTTCSGSASSYDWDTAVALTSSSAGHNDWRIPTENELLTIVEYRAYAPAINTVIFPTNTASLYFWSGSLDAVSFSYVWSVSFSYGGAHYGYNRSGDFAVRLVRGGQFFGSWGFKAQSGVAAGTAVTSNALKVYGSGGGISIQGGQYSINSGPYTSGPGTVQANDSVSVRVTSAPTPGTTTLATLSISATRGAFSATTADAPPANPTAPTAKLAAGSSHSAAIKSDGSLLTWGYNDSGQLGLGSTGGARTAPQTVTGSSYKSLTLGGSHSVALKTDGSLWTGGGNASGQLGDGSTTTRNSPAPIGTNYIAAAAGNAHTLGIKADNSLWAWGNNGSGQLGDGTANSATSPMPIGTGYFTVAAGTSHSVGINTDGGLWAWGSNVNGQLGDGTGSDRYAPTLIGKGYQAVAAGAFHTLALKTDGSLWAWGKNDGGQLGDGTMSNNRYTPRQIGSDFIAIAAGAAHSLALKQDGSLWAWGSNANGQLGDGTTTNSLVPKAITTNVSAIAANGNQTLVMKTDGTIWSWGSNSAGQLGDGTLVQRLSPVLVSNESANGPLDLLPEVPNATIPADKIPLFWTKVTKDVKVSTSITYDADQNKNGSVYIFARIKRSSALLTSSTPQAARAGTARASTDEFVTAVLGRGGWQEVLPDVKPEPSYTGVLDSRANNLYDAYQFDNTKDPGLFFIGYTVENSAKGRARAVISGLDTNASTWEPFVQYFDYSLANGSQSPVCKLTADPPSVTAGESSTITVNCNPTAASYAWTGASCDYTLATCTVKPTATTTYSVTSTTIGGATGAAASVTVTVCSPTLDASSALVPASANTGNVSVASSCSWTATSNASWITITSGASGSGNGTVTYVVAANSGTTTRTGTLTIAGKTFTVLQAAGSTVTAPVCTLSANPPSITNGGSSTLTANCNPAATSYIWTGGSCSSTSSTCTVTPTSTTTYSVQGANAGGSNQAVNATVTVKALTTESYAVPGTLGNDVFVLTAGNSYYGGGGNDTFIISPNTLRGDVTAKIIDSEGDNLIQLVDGMTVTASTFYSDAAQLTLSTGAKVQILGASKFKYQLGANALAGDTATIQTYSEFVTSLGASLSGTLPASGTAGYVVPTGFTQAAAPVPAVAGTANTVAGTVGDDVLVPSGGNNYLGGGGIDTYIISPYTLSGAVTAKIIDTEGANVIQFVNDMTIASSSFFSNAVQLMLSNGAIVQILGASSFSYQLGANAPAGETASSLSYAQFATALGASVPAAGAAAVSGSSNFLVSRP